MHSKKKTLSKMYDWRALVKLVVKDMHERHGTTYNGSELHYMGGLDTQLHPFIRIDLTPLQQPNQPKQ